MRSPLKLLEHGVLPKNCLFRQPPEEGKGAEPPDKLQYCAQRLHEHHGQTRPDYAEATYAMAL